VAPVLIAYTEDNDSDGPDGKNIDEPIAQPAGVQVNDLLLLFISTDHDLLVGTDGSDLPSHREVATSSATDTWTVLLNRTYGLDGQSCYVFYRFAQATDPGTYVFKGINPYSYGVQMLLRDYRGVDLVYPFHQVSESYATPASDYTGTTFTTPAPTLTTTVANTLAIVGFAPDTYVDTPQITAWPAGFDQNQRSVINKNWVSTAPTVDRGWTTLFSAEQVLAAPQTVGASSFGWTSWSTEHAYRGYDTWMIALTPAAVP